MGSAVSRHRGPAARSGQGAGGRASGWSEQLGYPYRVARLAEPERGALQRAPAGEARDGTDDLLHHGRGGVQHRRHAHHGGDRQDPRDRHPAGDGAHRRAAIGADLPAAGRDHRRWWARSSGLVLGLVDRVRGGQVGLDRASIPSIYFIDRLPVHVEPLDVAVVVVRELRCSRCWPPFYPGARARRGSRRSTRSGTNDGVLEARRLSARSTTAATASRSTCSTGVDLERRAGASSSRSWARAGRGRARCCTCSARWTVPTGGTVSTGWQRVSRARGERTRGAAQPEDRLRVPVPSPAARVHRAGECDDAAADRRERPKRRRGRGPRSCWRRWASPARMTHRAGAALGRRAAAGGGGAGAGQRPGAAAGRRAVGQPRRAQRRPAARPVRAAWPASYETAVVVVTHNRPAGAARRPGAFARGGTPACRPTGAEAVA